MKICAEGFSVAKRPLFRPRIPDWLMDTMDQEPQQLGEAFRLVPCGRRHCMNPVLEGMDGPFHVFLEPRLLDNDRELEALLAGRRIYELLIREGPADIQAVHRDQWRAAVPANQTPRLIVASHVCHQPIGYEIPWEALYPRRYQKTKEAAHNGIPEF